MFEDPKKNQGQNSEDDDQKGGQASYGEDIGNTQDTDDDMGQLDDDDNR